MTQEHIRQAAVHVHNIGREHTPGDALSQGISVAAEVLAKDGDFRFGNSPDERESTDRLVHAASSVLQHIDVTPELDFSENALDIARMTLAAWSFDRMVEEQMGLSVPEGHDRFVLAVAPTIGRDEADEEIAVVRDESLLDNHVGGLFRTAVIGAASLPDFGGEGGPPEWEKEAMSRHGGDELLGQKSIAYEGLRPTTGEAEDLLMDAMIDARNERDELVEFGGAATRDALREAAQARMAVTGPLPVQQEAMLAVEGFLTTGLGRPLTPREDRMIERSIDHVMERGPGAGPFDGAARQMLLDVSIQMQADRTIKEGSFGRRSFADSQIFDQVISMSAGMDTHWMGISPGEETTRDVAQGRYRETADRAIGDSILDGLSEAGYKPFSKSVDTGLAMHRTIAEANRSKISHILDEGSDALARGTAKGPKESETAVLGSYVSRSAER